jgi:hypothetical protein
MSKKMSHYVLFAALFFLPLFDSSLLAIQTASLEANRDAASLVEACFMNISSVERGDVLMRINRTEDSVAEVGVQELSLFTDTVEYHRVVFDFSKNKLFYASTSEKKVLVFNNPGSDHTNDQTTFRVIKGLYFNGPDKLILRVPQDQVRKLGEKTSLAEAISQASMPDVRLFGISPFGAGEFESVKNSLVHLHGDHITQIQEFKNAKKQVTFRFVDSSETNQQGMDTEFLIDIENLVPIKIVDTIISEGRRHNTFSVQTFEWQDINNVKIARKVRREANVHSRVGGVLHPHPLVQVAEIHCFSLNEELDDSIFEVENFVKLDRFMKMCDPQATNAVTLLKEPKKNVPAKD